MKKILEITPEGRTLYTMPPMVFEWVVNSLQGLPALLGRKVGMAQVLAVIGPALRQQIKVEKLPEPELESVSRTVVFEEPAI